MSQRMHKRRKYTHNIFVDDEAGHGDSEPETEEGEIYSTGISYTQGTVVMESRLRRIRTRYWRWYDTYYIHCNNAQMTDEDNEELVFFLTEGRRKREKFKFHLRRWAVDTLSGMWTAMGNRMQGMYDRLFVPDSIQWLTQVGREEEVVFKALNRATHPDNPDRLAKSVIGRCSIPGRVFVEVNSESDARTFALSIVELNPNAIRLVRADPVKKGTRCYTIGNSAEGPTQIMAPKLCSGAQVGKWRARA